MIVEGPDGKEYEFPEGTTQEQAVAFFKRQKRISDPSSPTGISFEMVAPPKRESVDTRPAIEMQNLLQSIGQGITFGWGDEITSSMAAGLSKMLDDAEYRKAYDDIVERQRKQGKEFTENYPGLDLALQLGSGLITGKAPLDVVRKVGRQVGRAVPGAISGVASQMPRATGMLKTAGESGALGAVAGAGYGEGEILDDALSGASTGAIIGAAVPTAIAVAKKASTIGKSSLDVLANSMGFGSGETVARRRLLQAIERDGDTPESLLAKLKQEESMGYPSSLVDVAGPNVSNLAQRVMKRSGTEYAPLAERHSQRLGEIPARAKSSLEADLILSDPNNKTYFDWNKSINRQMDSIDNDLTQRFVTEERPMPDIVKDKFEDLIKGDGDFKDAFKRANELLKGRTDINIRDPKFGLATLYYTKKGLDSMLESSRKPLFDPEVAKRLKDKSNSIDNLLREMSGDYSSKADFISELNRKKEVLNLGSKIQDPKFTPDELRDSLRTLTEDDLPLFLSGVRESTLNKFGKDLGKGQITDIVFGRPASSLRDKMETAYKFDPESFNLMLERMGKYDKMIETSKTIPKLATTNPLSAVIDPESRDVALAFGASGLSGMLGIPHLSAPLAAFGASRLIPSSAAQQISRAGYGPIEDTEKLLRPLVRSPLREFADRVSNKAGSYDIAPRAYGVWPQIFNQEPNIEEDY